MAVCSQRLFETMSRLKLRFNHCRHAHNSAPVAALRLRVPSMENEIPFRRAQADQRGNTYQNSARKSSSIRRKTVAVGFQSPCIALAPDST